MRSRAPAYWPTRVLLMVGIAVVVLVGLGCAPARQFVDGYPVGSKVACGLCQDHTREAERWLDATSPGHPEVVDRDFYMPDTRNADGDTILLTRSGGRGDYVVALTLADGSVRAVFVACGAGLTSEYCSTTSAAGFRTLIVVE